MSEDCRDHVNIKALVEELEDGIYELKRAFDKLKRTMIPPDDLCCICLDENKSNNKEWIQLTCNHKMHTDCLNEWFKTANTCPICKKIITDDNEVV